MRASPRRHSPFIRYAALAAVLAATLAVAGAYEQTSAVLGYWREPGGSIIRVAPCERQVCVEIVWLPARDHGFTDLHNPDPKLRSRPLCGLRIGEGFVQVDPQHASGGRLYDPRSGHTYSGEMTAEGNLLHLRGYIEFRIFGRTQTWARASQPPPC